MSTRVVGMILLSLAMLLEGCATGTLHESLVSELSGPSRDAFQELQRASGLEEEARHPAGGALYQEQARRLRAVLARTPVTRENFAPRRTLSWLLNEVLDQGLGEPLIWHVADARVANFLGEAFEKKGWTRTTVQHTPPIQ